MAPISKNQPTPVTVAESKWYQLHSQMIIRLLFSFTYKAEIETIHLHIA